MQTGIGHYRFLCACLPCIFKIFGVPLYAYEVNWWRNEAMSCLASCAAASSIAVAGRAKNPWAQSWNTLIMIFPFNCSGTHWRLNCVRISPHMSSSYACWKGKSDFIHKNLLISSSHTREMIDECHEKWYIPYVTNKCVGMATFRPTPTFAFVCKIDFHSLSWSRGVTSSWSPMRTAKGVSTTVKKTRGGYSSVQHVGIARNKKNWLLNTSKFGECLEKVFKTQLPIYLLPSPLMSSMVTFAGWARTMALTSFIFTTRLAVAKKEHSGGTMLPQPCSEASQSRKTHHWI